LFYGGVGGAKLIFLKVEQFKTVVQVFGQLTNYGQKSI
jgi:hypothetical protein